ncbi:Protein RTF2-like protein [Armadillidium nasatum]|uniref:Replication termination factor 2 n=1 Tax=Armadillidium nasatum TaxID=96803 RepID=A0A5N5SXG6_9CRUS|nr:Protein RTF2-like protein [Armadillidium nasatum]KAB7499908.1 Protein RTF2-like protein [Armadillidium nasatum]
MGCDGGTIPRRDELVKTKKKPEQKDKDADRLYRWRHCSISQSPLQHPIVACEFGRLYNKEEIISRLLSKTKDPSMDHIKSLKDIKELILTRNPSYREDMPKGDEYFDSQNSEYICPITSQEMNGKSKFYFIWSCGCVISERALKEIKSDRCHVCNKTFLQSNVIPLNPSDEETEKLEAQMIERREKKKLEKKEKRKMEEEVSTEQKKKKKINNEASQVSKSEPGTSKSTVSSYASDLLRGEAFKNICSTKFSVAKDTSKSEVFKSIFDTHKSAKHKQTGHWVTCNPQYF